MKKLHFDNIYDLATHVSLTFEELKEIDSFPDVTVIAKYDEAKELIECLICSDHRIFSIDIENPELDQYDDEWIITLNDDGIWCERFKRKTGYIEDESMCTFICGNCSSAVISHCCGNHIYEISIGDEDDGKEYEVDCECDCECCKNAINTDEFIRQMKEAYDTLGNFINNILP